MYSAKILLDSTFAGVRLTTMELTFPRKVLAEFNTHRVFSRNSASSRAIPIETMLRNVRENPYIPTKWTRNGKGMQGHGLITDPKEVEQCRAKWLKARDRAVESAEDLLALGVHKQTTNRLLEPFLWHTVIVTSTEWDNFFHQRSHSAADPDIEIPATKALNEYIFHEPTKLQFGEWHMPLLPDQHELGREFTRGDMVKISVARCARVSYLTHDGKRDPSKDLDLFERLTKGGHMSPFEHVARAGGFHERANHRSNFRAPWVQYRKLMDNEWDRLDPALPTPV